MHPDSNKIVGRDASTGSLGHGLSMAVGMGLGARYLKKEFKTVCLWVTASAVKAVYGKQLWHVKLQACNVITIVDRNRLMIDGFTEDDGSGASQQMAPSIELIEIDGHDFDQICEALDKAWNAKEKPVIILANTVKGKGVDFMENNVVWHYASADPSCVRRQRHPY